MESETLIDAIEDAGYKARWYSGRGMFGRSCVGVVLSRGASEFTFALELAREITGNAETEEAGLALLDELSRLRTKSDAMGVDTIIYFPNVAWVSPKDEEEDDGPFPAEDEGSSPPQERS